MIRVCRSGLAHVVARGVARSSRALLALLPAIAACHHSDGAGPPVAESIALTSTATSMAIGQSATLYVHASDANGTRIAAYSGVTWSSSNPTVASVSKADTTAIVTGLGAGEAVITATVRAGLSASATVRVGAVPIISTQPPAVVFTGYRGIPIAPQTVVVSNTGAGALNGLSATASVPWLTAAFVDGNSANPTASLRLQASGEGLNNGTYSGNVSISSTTAGVVPRTIAVTLQLAAGPVAFKIEALSAPSQGGSAGKPVLQPPSVIVRAADETPVPGVPVTFAVSGGGTIAPTGVVMTGLDGIASLTSWTLGAQAGAAQVVTASSPGLAGSPVTFTATTLSASKIVKVSGDLQSGVLGRPLGAPLVVRVTDPNDAPVPNAAVTFAAVGGGIAPATVTTDAAGEARTTWTLGPAEGPQSATATLALVPGAPFVTFTATATGATAIAKIGGDGQQSFAGSALPQALRVRVTGANDEPVVGVPVTFAPAGGDGTASPSVATTDAAGEAAATWTLPPSIGVKSLTASIETATGPASVTFSATATDPPPGGVLIVDGNNQTGQGGSVLPKQVVARVVTTIGTGIPGVTVTFTPATGAGQSFSPTSATTDANGEARASWTIGATLGAYTATVATPGLPSKTITATATQLPPNVGMFTGSASKVPGGVAPTSGDQAVLTYSGPASGEVALAADGSFTTPALPAGTYTLTISSKTGAFPPTTVYAVVLPGGQITSVGTISVAYPGTGTVEIAVHSCPIVGDANGTATVKVYSGINGDQSGGGPAYTWTIPLGNYSSQSGIAYGIYTMVITAQKTSDSSVACAPYTTTLVHSFTTTGGTTNIPLIIVLNP